MGNLCFQHGSVSTSVRGAEHNNVENGDASETNLDVTTHGSHSKSPSCSSNDSPFLPFLASSWPGSILSWNEDDLNEFASCLNPVTFKSGNEISIGAVPSSFFIVVEGCVEIHAILPSISKKTNNIREYLCRKNVGDILFMETVLSMVSKSNLKFLHEKDSEREDVKEHKDILKLVDTVTIKSVSESTLLKMDWDLFEHKFEKERQLRNSTLDIEMLKTIMRTNLYDYLSNIPMFKSLPQSKLELVTKLCHYAVKHAGSTICSEGEEGEEIFIILGGQVKVTAAASPRMVELFEGSDLTSESETNACLPISNDLKRSRKKLMQARQHIRKDAALVKNQEVKAESPSQDIPAAEVELATLGNGEYFGEISIFVDVPRQATVTASTNALMASISKSAFRDLFHTMSPEIKMDIDLTVRQHMLLTLLQSKSPFLKDIDSELSKKMASFTKISKFEENKVIFREGDEAEDFYFVYSGNLSVLKKEGEKDRLIGSLLSGDYFGEMALLDGAADKKRCATIVANEKAILLVITKEDFHACFKDAPELLAEFQIRIQGENVQLQPLLLCTKSRAIFEEYLLQCNKMYYLLCYEDARLKDSGDINKDISQLTKFVEKYTSIDSDHYIEFPQQDVTTLEVAISFLQKESDASEKQTSDQKQNMLEPFHKRVREILAADILTEFKQSEMFGKFRKHLQVYDDCDMEFLV